ncbi:DNA polymerase [Microbacterium phage Curie]
MKNSPIVSNSFDGQQPSKNKRKSKTKPWLAADFETTTDPFDVRVWAWGVARVDNPDDVVIDNSLEGFIDFISMESSITFFHNLRFDGMFILDYILNQGYTYVEGRSNPGPKEFKALISNTNKFYSITVGWENGNITEFRDSAKKFPGMSISRIAKTFKLDEVKGSIDYHAPRPVGHVITDEERSYLNNDVVILAKALQIVKETGMLKLTVAADAKAEYISLIGDKLFETRFPVLSYAMDAEIRRAYRGGFTYASPRYLQCRTAFGVVLDVNSLYPYIMYSKPQPYGEPEYVQGEVEPTDARPLTVFGVTFTATLKKDHVPCIQIKGTSMYAPTEYLSVIEEPTTLMVTNVDWKLYNDHYDIEILEHHGGWRFKAVVGMFQSYIDKWSKIKAESTGGLRELAKLQLNALYGRMGLNPNVQGKIPALIDGKVKLELGAPEIRDSLYVPVAVFVTSYGRDLTVRAAQRNYDTFAYADTDSVHLVGVKLPDDVDPKNTGAWEGEIAGLSVHPSRMGAWKIEYPFDQAFYIRAKAYMEHLPDTDPDCDDDTCTARHDYHNAFAGVPDHVSNKLTFDDAYDGNILTGKLIPHIVPGGVILKDVPYELKF